MVDPQFQLAFLLQLFNGGYLTMKKAPVYDTVSD
jgi:hypothetical protein